MTSTANDVENTCCIVTGAAGFVGSHLAERLLSLGCRVIGIDDFSSGCRENMSAFEKQPGFSFHECSVTSPGLLKEMRERHPAAAYCFHLAAIVSVPYSVEHPEETMEVDCHAAVSLLREAEAFGFRRFVFAGSAAEYGDDERLPLREEYASENTRHLSPYGRAKYLASAAVASSRIGVALRCFNIYGPRQDPRSPYSGVISRFVDMALQERSYTVFGDGQQTRDFVFVSDVVDAYLCAAGLSGAPPAPSGVYNVGTGRATSIVELAETISAVEGRHALIEHLPERAGDIRHSVSVPEALEKAAGWRSRVSLADGLKETVSWARTAGTQ